MRLKLLPQLVMPISDNLVPFLLDQEISSGQSILVECISDSPDIDLYQTKGGLQARQPHMSYQGKFYLFTFATGQFLTNHEFTHIRLWTPFEKIVSTSMDGYPWLQLIIWGRLSIIGCCYLHGAIVVIDEKFVMLLGDSGVGKSTLSGIAVQQGFSRLTEENPFLVLHEDNPWGHATPWPGMSGPEVPSSGPLHMIFFLRHAPTNSLKKLKSVEASRRLLGNARMFNWLPQTIPAAIETLDKTLAKIPVYDFGFVPQKSAIQAIQKLL